MTMNFGRFSQKIRGDKRAKYVIVTESLAAAK